MRSKERVISALNGVEPDRPPIFATVTPQIGYKLNDYLNIKNDGLVNSFFANRISFTKALTSLGNDCICVAANWAKDFRPKTDENGNITDEWGIKWHSTGIYDEMIFHPLSQISTITELDDYDFPDPLAEGRFDHAENQINQYGEEFAVIGEQECTIFELSWYLVGLEKFLMDLLLEKEYLFELMDRVMEFNLTQALRLVEIGADIIWTGDDMGNQDGMMIDPDLWRKVFKPRMKHVFSTLKSKNPNIKIAYHSCGSIRPIIPDLIEIGLDILNPLQPLAKNMEAQRLKDDFGNKLSFFGGVDIQNLLPNGSPNQIKETVRNLKHILGENGRYIIAPAHNIQPDTPIENVITFFEEAKTIQKN
jgi:uroporphyrinogen decarboxylase